MNTIWSSRLVWFACIASIILPRCGLGETVTPIMTIEADGGYVVFSPDGKRFAGRVPGKSWRTTDVRVWEVASGKELFVLKGHTNGIWKISFSPDGKRLVTNENWEAKTWDLEQKKAIRSFKTPAFTRSSVFLSDGKRIATGHDNGRVLLWDADTGRRAGTLNGHTDWVVDLVLSPDGKHLASASVDMTAKIWDLETGKAIRTLSGHTWYLNRVDFGLNGERLVTSSDDMTAKIWNLKTGEELFTLRGHNEWVVGVALSPDGKWAVTGGNDGTARIWDATTGKKILTISDHAKRVSGVAFSPDGRILATAGHDKTIRLWDVHALTARE
jgi:WD40 repeat protein